MQTSRSTSIAQPILWVAIVALMLASLGNLLRLTTCIGGCAPVASECCTLGAPASDETCCACCTDEEADEEADDERQNDERQVGPKDSPADGPPADQDKGASGGDCPSECCITIAFDTELAPVDMQVNWPDMCSVAFLPFAQACLPMPARAGVRPRLFDRGPPRVDRCTALRACTVLLI